MQRPIAASFATALGLVTGCAITLGPITSAFALEPDTSYDAGTRPVAVRATASAYNLKAGAAAHCDEMVDYLDLAAPWIKGERNLFKAGRRDLRRLSSATQTLGEAGPARLRTPWQALSRYLDHSATGAARQIDFVRLSETLREYDSRIEADALTSCGITWPEPTRRAPHRP